MGEIPPTFFRKRNRVRISRDRTEVMRTLQWDREMSRYKPIGRLLYREEDEVWAPNKDFDRYNGTKIENYQVEIIAPKTIFDSERWNIERIESSFMWNQSICCPECLVKDCAAFCKGVDAHGNEAGCGSPFIWATDNCDKERGYYVPHLQLYIGLTEEMKEDYPWLANLRLLVVRAKKEAAKKPSRSKGVQAASKIGRAHV